MQKPVPTEPITDCAYEREGDVMRFTFTTPDGEITGTVGIVGEKLDLHPDRSDFAKRVAAVT